MEDTELDFSYDAFDAVLRYALDNPKADKDVPEYISQALGLDENVFFENLYVERNIQANLYEAILSNSIVLVHGFPGTGKTTIVYRIINEFRRNYIVYPIIIDFKHTNKLEKYSNDFDFKKWHDDTVIRFIQANWKIPQVDVVSFFCNSAFYQKEKSLELNSTFIEIKDELHSLYEIGAYQDSFDDWISKCYYHSTGLGNKIRALESNLTVHNFLRYLSEVKPQIHSNIDKLSVDKKALIIIFYDNIDTIVSDEARQDFYKFIRENYGSITDLARLIITSRNAHISNDRFPDRGAFPRKKIPIDYNEFLDPSQLNIELDKLKGDKDYYSATDAMLAEEKLTLQSKSTFAYEIVKLRFDFLYNTGFKNLQKKGDFPVSEIQFRKIERLTNLLLTNEHITNAFLELSNHDRHYMFINLNDFVTYLLKNLKIDIETMGHDDIDRKYILESYLYHWIVGKATILNVEYYDIVRDLRIWEDSKQTLGCSRNHLLFSVIYNLTKKQRGEYSDENRATVFDVIYKMLEIGINDEDLRQVIFSLYKQGKDNLSGMLESSRYYHINTHDDLRENDLIWLTPRTGFVLDYLGYKFMFISALLQKNKFKDRLGKLFEYDEKQPVTKYTIGINLFFLCRLAVMHLNGLLHIRKQLSINNADWFTIYRRAFCIRAFGNRDAYGELQINNISESYLKFLKRMHDITGYDFISNEIIQQFVEFDRQYRKLVSDIIFDHELPEFEIGLLTKVINFDVFN